MCAACSGEVKTEDDDESPVLRRKSQPESPVAAAWSTQVRGLTSGGAPLPADVRAFFEPRFGVDFGGVRIHDHDRAAQAARSVQASAYTLGQNIVFAAGRYAPQTADGRRLLAHELTHVVQQQNGAQAAPSASLEIGPADDPYERQADAVAEAVLSAAAVPTIAPAAPSVRRRAAPYIKKVTVHLTPKENAELTWEGTPPATAPGKDAFPVSTGKGYSDPGDPAGTCTRSCCSDATTQCDAPYNKPGSVGSCCTYVGNTFWTGKPLKVHNTWKWWTPIQPYYSTRGIALHGHPEVTGDPIGHGCVRMDDENAQRIFEFSNGANTNVTIDGRASPVLCDVGRRCGGTSGSLDGVNSDARMAWTPPAPGQEGERS
jgi:hypothetical protein